MHWRKISGLLCIFGLLKDFRPSESFITDYLVGPWKNFTEVQVNQEIYPVGTYSHFSMLVVVFLITDFFRYKPIIIVCGLSGAIAFLLMVLGKDVLSIQLVEFFYGVFLSTEVAYYTYIYAKVDKVHYQEVTSHTKAASLIGRCTAGVVAQLTTSFGLLDYHELHFLTLGAFICAAVWALFLPPVGQSIYFHRNSVDYEDPVALPCRDIEKDIDQTLCDSQQQDKHKAPKTNPSLSSKLRTAYYLLWKDFLQAFTSLYVIKWIAWWALSTCGYLQVANYIQLLWQDAVEPGAKIYNGAVDCLYALIGAASVFAVGQVPLNWRLFGDLSVALFSFIEGALLLLACYSYNIWVLYAVYIVFGIVYHTMVTVASFEVAKHISEDSYGLIFGVTIFFALLLESILTAIVLHKDLNLHIRSQYYVYAGYFIVIAAAYMILGIITLIQSCRKDEECKVWATNESETNNTQVEDDGKSTKSLNAS